MSGSPKTAGSRFAPAMDTVTWSPARMPAPLSRISLVAYRSTTAAACAGTWTLGDLTVNRIGFGAMRLTSNVDGTPSDRGRAVTVLRRAVELGVNHIDTAAFYLSALRAH